MSEAIVSTHVLPSPIRERFSTEKVIVKNHESGVMLIPLNDISIYRGIAKGSGFTTETLRQYREHERVLEDSRSQV